MELVLKYSPALKGKVAEVKINELVTGDNWRAHIECIAFGADDGDALSNIRPGIEELRNALTHLLENIKGEAVNELIPEGAITISVAYFENYRQIIAEFPNYPETNMVIIQYRAKPEIDIYNSSMDLDQSVAALDFIKTWISKNPY